MDMALSETGEHRPSVVSTSFLVSRGFTALAASYYNRGGDVGAGRVDDELVRSRAYQHVHVLHWHGAEQYAVAGRERKRPM